MDAALWVFNLCNTFIIFDYFQKTYGFRYEGRGAKGVVITAFYFAHTWTNLQHIAAWNIISEILLINFFSFIFFKPKKGKFYFNAIFQFYLLSLDLIFTCISSLIHRQVFTQMQVEAVYIPYVAVNFLVLFLTYKKVMRLFWHEFVFLYLTKWKVIVSLTMLFQFALVIFISLYFDAYIVNLAGIVVMFYISCFNMGSLFLFLYAQKIYETREKTRIYEMQNVALYDSLLFKDTLLKAVTEIVCEHFAQRPATQAEMDARLKRTQAKLAGLRRYECGNEAVNAIVNHLIWRAAAAGIRLKEEVEVINWDFIDKMDITMLLGSLLYNALEVSGRQEAKVRRIGMTVLRKRDFVLLKIANTCDPAAVQYDDEQEKAFQDGSQTIRIRTAQAAEVCRKNHGTMSFGLRGDLFIVTVCLPCRIADQKFDANS